MDHGKFAPNNSRRENSLPKVRAEEKSLRENSLPENSLPETRERTQIRKIRSRENSCPENSLPLLIGVLEHRERIFLIKIVSYSAGKADQKGPIMFFSAFGFTVNAAPLTVKILSEFFPLGQLKSNKVESLNTMDTLRGQS